MTRVETPKNLVVIEADRVVKTFKKFSTGAKRYRSEVESLRRLCGLDGVPELLEASDRDLRLVVTRIPGVPLKSVDDPPDGVFLGLRVVGR